MDTTKMLKWAGAVVLALALAAGAIFISNYHPTRDCMKPGITLGSHSHE
jgi:hypothetical protein